MNVVERRNTVNEKKCTYPFQLAWLATELFFFRITFCLLQRHNGIRTSCFLLDKRSVVRATLAGASRGRDPSFPHLSVSAIIPFVPNPGFEPMSSPLFFFFFHSSELRSFYVSRRDLWLPCFCAFPRPHFASKIILPNRNCAM
jgi:hypothetical protein